MEEKLIRGHLDGLLLAVLVRGPGHGYAIIQALRLGSGGEFDLPEGTVYPALHRLERAGAVASEWSDEGGRRRRVYRLTAHGREVLKGKQLDWRRFVAAASGILDPGPVADA